ncbi:uncharacterized protein BN457_00945 [Dorea sp. CAG:105]|nr:uncharacterized protein BN457_00945 [Dorea sp. CAG:105]
MKESKDPFDRMILDDLEREADEIRRNVAAANLPPMTNEQKERIRENIQKEIDAREVQKICEQLPKEYQEALKIGMETIEKEKRKSGKDNETEATKVRADKETEELKAGADKETEEGEPGFGANKETEEGELSAGTDEKKHRFRRKAYLSRVAAAVVIVLLAGGIGVTSFGGPERVMEMMKRNVGSREVEQVDSNKDNLVIKEENEEEAYQKIKDELGIDPVRIVHKIKGFEFIQNKMEEDSQMAELMYRYKNETIVYVINTMHSKDSWGLNVDDKQLKSYKKVVKGKEFRIKEYETVKSKEKRYSARFDYKGGEYYIVGVMSDKDFYIILKNLYFS